MAETEQENQQAAEQPAPETKLEKPKALSAADRKFQEEQRKIQLEKGKAVATQATSIFDPIAYAQLKQLATDLIAGGAVAPDADTPEKLLVKLQAGFELGMTPVQSQNSLYIVNGRTTIWGAALIARLRQKGWAVKFTDEAEGKCTITVTQFMEGPEKGVEISDTFLYQDAVDSGYTTGKSGEKIGWKKGQNRKLKMRYGAASQLVKTYLPDVLGGNNIGVAEIDGEIIEGEIVEAEETRKERMAAAEAERANLSKDFDAKAVKS